MAYTVPFHLQEARLARARRSLEGLSVGDAFGEQFFHLPDRAADYRARATHTLPIPPWPSTADTQMVLSIVCILRQHGTIAPAHLATSFAQQFDPSRGYGPSMNHLLRSIRPGAPWQKTATSQFSDQGSFGNGAAMRIAPVGAYFAETMDDVIREASTSAQVTHTHPEAMAGSIAVAVAAA